MSSSSVAKKQGLQSELVAEVSKLVTQITGVQLGERQIPMVENRVRKRILQLGLEDEQDYLEYFRNNRNSESEYLVSLLTTHHTYFFREYAHFEYLEKTALPKIIEEKRREKTDFVIRIWSAACSRGQEVYSLSMFLSHILPKLGPEFTFEILGTDVDPESVEIARNGVYPWKEVQEIPAHFLNGNWARGTGEIDQYAKVNKKIKSPCSFEVMNLMSFSGIAKTINFDIIFCRNVFIYFTPEQIKDTAKQFLVSLKPGGYLFVGISESLNGIGIPVSVVGPSIYQHPAAQSKMSVVPVLAAAPKGQGSVASLERMPGKILDKPLHVLCVDDSPSILALLNKILTIEHGFKVVATASNGFEATKKLKGTRVDLITLDIHMPEQGGLEFLQSSENKGHPPVVMISSVSRDDAGLALRCLEAGAIDYIEKPALSTLADRADEIRVKLKYAFEATENGKTAHTVEQSFAKSSAQMATPKNKLRVIVSTLTDRKKLVACLKEFVGVQPPTFILMEGVGAGLNAFQASLSSELKSFTFSCPDSKNLRQLETNQIYLMDSKVFFEEVQSHLSPERISVLVFGQVSQKVAGNIRGWPGAQILLDDRGNKNSKHYLKNFASDVVPSSSFSYMSHEFLSNGTLPRGKP